jgi:hypothetical protein
MSKPPKTTKTPPLNVKGKGITQTKADQTLENSKKQTIKDIFNKNFTPEQIAEILADPEKSQRLIQGVFGNLVSIEKLFDPKASINLPTKNTLLGTPGTGLAGGYGGHPSEGYLQFAPSKKNDGYKNLAPIEDPTLKDPKRVERASSQKFVKVSQQAETPELKFLKTYKDGDAIAKTLLAEIQKQIARNPNDENAFNQIVTKYENKYTKDLKNFFAETESGQNILKKITPKR